MRPQSLQISQLKKDRIDMRIEIELYKENNVY